METLERQVQASVHSETFERAMQFADTETAALVSALRSGHTLHALAAGRKVTPVSMVADLHHRLSTAGIQSGVQELAEEIAKAVRGRTASGEVVVHALGPGNWAGLDLLAVVATATTMFKTGVVIGPAERDGRRPALFHAARGTSHPVEFFDDTAAYNVRVADLRRKFSPAPPTSSAKPSFLGGAAAFAAARPPFLDKPARPAAPSPRSTTPKVAASAPRRKDRPEAEARAGKPVAKPRPVAPAPTRETPPPGLENLRPLELALLRAACRGPVRVGEAVAGGFGGRSAVSRALDDLKRRGLVDYVRGKDGGFVPAHPDRLPEGWRTAGPDATGPATRTVPPSPEPQTASVERKLGEVTSRFGVAGVSRMLDVFLGRSVVASRPVREKQAGPAIPRARPAPPPTGAAARHASGFVAPAPPPRDPAAAARHRKAIMSALSATQMADTEIAAVTGIGGESLRLALEELRAGAFVVEFPGGRLGIPGAGCGARSNPTPSERPAAEVPSSGKSHVAASAGQASQPPGLPRARALLDRAAAGEPLALGSVGAAASMPLSSVRSLVRREYGSSLALGADGNVVRPRAWGTVPDRVLRLLAGEGRMAMLRAAASLGERFDDVEAAAAARALAGMPQPDGAVAAFLRSCATEGLIDPVGTAPATAGRVIATWAATPALAALASAVRFDAANSDEAATAREAAACAPRPAFVKVPVRSKPVVEGKGVRRERARGGFSASADKLADPILERWWAGWDLSDHAGLADDLRTHPSLVTESLRRLVRNRQLPDDPDLVGDLCGRFEF